MTRQANNAPRFEARANLARAEEELRETEEEVRRLLTRIDEIKAELTANRDRAELDELINEAVRKAAVTGESGDLRELRRRQLELDREAEDLAAQLEVLRGLVPDVQASLVEAEKAAKRAHRGFWRAVEAEAKESARAALEPLARAYQAYNAAGGHYASKAPEQFAEALLRELGLAEAVRALPAEVDGTPTAAPSAEYRLLQPLAPRQVEHSLGPTVTGGGCDGRIRAR